MNNNELTSEKCKISLNIPTYAKQVHPMERQEKKEQKKVFQYIVETIQTW